jgi:hypothetical protein
MPVEVKGLCPFLYIATGKSRANFWGNDAKSIELKQEA